MITTTAVTHTLKNKLRALCHKRRQLFIFVTSLLLITGCFKHYYKSMAVTSERSTSSEKTNLVLLMQKMNKYIVLHYNNEIWHFTKIQQDPQTGQVQGIIEPVDRINENIINARGENRSKRYEMSEQKPVLQQAHVYLNGYSFRDEDRSILTVAGSQIELIDMNRRDGGRTFGSHLLGILTIGVIATAAFIIVLAILCNCPQLAIVKDGAEIPQGSLFPGAMGASLERQDYVILQDSLARADTLKLRITNELPETEFINETKLLSVSTASFTRMATGTKGQLVAFNPQQTRISAITPGGAEVSEAIAAEDMKRFDFTEMGSDEELNKLFLAFQKQTFRKKPLLVVHARQSKWMEQVADFGFRQMGTLFTTWAKRMDKADPETFRRKNISRGLSLNVYRKSEGSWRYIGSFEQAGTRVCRTMAMNLENVNSSEELELKFETAHGCWEIDYVTLTDQWSDSLAVTEIPLYSATHRSGRNVSAKLLNNDTSYLQLAELDDHADLVYIRKRNTGTRLVFSAKGFYRHTRKYTNKPNYDFIREMHRDSLKYHQLSTILDAYRLLALEQKEAKAENR